MNEKIQKVLAHTGIGSRRQVEKLIQDGKILINNRLAKLGDRMTSQDKITVLGRELNLLKSQQQKCRVLLYHKSEGEMCTRADPEGRRIIFDHLPPIRHGRWISIGRLDFNTAGLLLITNQGELANKLMHPKTQIEREYAVRLRGQANDAQVKRLKAGVRLNDGYAKFNDIRDAGGTDSNHWYHVIVREGRNRLVRRLFESQGMIVNRLIRVRFGNISLPRTLRKGHWLELTPAQYNSLFD